MGNLIVKLARDFKDHNSDLVTYSYCDSTMFCFFGSVNLCSDSQLIIILQSLPKKYGIYPLIDADSGLMEDFSCNVASGFIQVVNDLDLGKIEGFDVIFKDLTLKIVFIFFSSQKIKLY